MVSASQMQAKLQAQQAAEIASVRKLEHERSDIASAALNGDVKARKRLGVIRGLLGDHAAILSEVAQMLNDVEPRVVQERLDAALAERRERALYLGRIVAVMGEKAALLDAALAEVAAAAVPVAALMEAARHTYADLTVRDMGSNDIGAVMIGRMLALDSGLMKSLPELLQDRAVQLGIIPAEITGGFLPGAPPVQETLSQAAFVMTQRVQDVLAGDVVAEAEVELVEELA